MDAEERLNRIIAEMDWQVKSCREWLERSQKEWPDDKAGIRVAEASLRKAQDCNFIVSWLSRHDAMP